MYLTTQEVADLLGITPAALQKWRGEDTGPRWVRLGGRTIRYPEPDLRAWINRQPKGPS